MACFDLGASDGRIHCWNAETGNRVCTLVSDSMSGQTVVSMNPKFMLLVSASNQLVGLPTIISLL
jgi:COMPASS component SWD2